MTKHLLVAGVAACATLALGLSAAAAHADELVHGVNYGAGNNYTPGNWTITTLGALEEGLRGHVYKDNADAPVGDVYTVALGQSASFDFAIDPDAHVNQDLGIGPASLASALITITNRAGGSAGFNPFFLPDNGSTAPDDNINNSERLVFSFLNSPLGDINYDANVNSTYDIVLHLTEASGASLDDHIVINQGSGFAVPEPASWALMIVGFGAAGAMLRRKTLQPA